ncbi:MAG: hypothetical protein JXX29_23500 [Deltaproteobacteria bacterium]|nr:hypothetical protein [Deltaproteobacteria bacterium]MBN2674667.1 hypothetical protein [Deltaproteobacteria bacterium]
MNFVQAFQRHTVFHRAPRSTGRSIFYIIAMLLLLCPKIAFAKAGTHGRAVSTWDTTRSTVVFNYQHGFLLGGGFSNMAGYNANFTSTTGRLSAQFGLQYVNLGPDDIDITMHGVAGSVVALYGLPMGKRYENGMPKAAFSFYGGAVPTIISNGEHNYITFPLTIGLGMEINPIKHLSIVPWVEGAPSFNLDTIIRYEEFQNRISEGTVDDVYIEYGPNGEVLDVQVDDAVIDDLVSDVIDYDASAAFRIRGGLSIVINLGNKIDLQINGSVAQMGTDFDAPPTVYIGGALAFAWDDPPLGILPEEQRAKSLSCKAVGAKFTTCAEYQALIQQIREEEAAKLKKESEQKKEIIVHEEPATTQAAPAGKPMSPQGVGTPASASAPTDSTETPAKPTTAPATEPSAPTTTPPAATTPETPTAPAPAKPKTGNSLLPSLSQPIAQ